MQDQKNNINKGSRIESYYSSGEYFKDPDKYSSDAEFKAKTFLKLFLRILKQHNLNIQSYIDVGCGSGEVVKKIAKVLQMNGCNLLKIKGYDVSPHVRTIKSEGIEYVHGDFCRAGEYTDLVTLFDVFEHVPDPIGFIRLVAEQCKIIGFHIPLDNSLNVAIRDLFRTKLTKTGHLIFLDTVGALNLLTLAGLKIIDYEYSYIFFAPSGRNTLLSKLILPFRWGFSKCSPWLLSKTIGGISLLVVAMTPKGSEESSLEE